MIRPSVVLTAAHCIDRSVTGATSFWAGGIPVVEAVKDPDYSDYLSGHDLAILHLAYPMEGVEPKPLTRTRMTHDAVGQIDHFLGFGETHADVPASAALRYEARVPVTYVEWTYFGWEEGAPSYTCYGDSGGPHLMMVDGQEVLVGVTSYGGEHCADLVGAQRVDVALDLIHDFIDEHDPEPPEHCDADGVCGPRSCGAIDPDCPCADDGFCTTACEEPDRDPDCPLGCSKDGSCVRAGCPTHDADCGEKPTGETCASNVECASDHCAPGGDGKICVPRCGANRECPSELSCSDPSGLCLPDRGNGCAISTNGSGWFALVWVLAALIASRRARIQ